jgi:hypothetical protein
MKRFKRKFKRFTPLSPALLRSQFYRVETNPKKNSPNARFQRSNLAKSKTSTYPKTTKFYQAQNTQEDNSYPIPIYYPSNSGTP